MQTPFLLGGHSTISYHVTNSHIIYQKNIYSVSASTIIKFLLADLGYEFEDSKYTFVNHVVKDGYFKELPNSY
jgi:hypothetical protein